MADLTAVRDALLGIEAAFGQAARRRVQIIRAIAKVEVAPEQVADRARLVEALLRAQAADADGRSTPAERLRTTVAHARVAEQARERLGVAEIDALHQEMRAVSQEAADQAARVAGRAGTDAPEDVGIALADYVTAVGALHTLEPASADESFEAALAAAEAAQARLEAAIERVSG